MNFDQTFRTLPAFLYEDVRPTPIKNPKLIHVTNLKKDLGLDLSDSELMSWLNGERNLPGEQRLSSRYAGHQFGVWAGQLGDGRAISLGEVLTKDLGRQEIQTKGSGLTPFSRMGDGKAVIRSSVREYLCSEAMFGLNIPTTRVLALITGDDKVYREQIERSAIVARVFPSNLRFGHFEMCFHFKKEKELDALIKYTQKTFYPEFDIPGMLSEMMKRTANLIASWQDVGFCHGVMNTDNMSALGLTIDYGPYGFLEDTKLDYVCNHSDVNGRYAYNNQPQIGQWNLERLLVCFMNHVPREKLEEILNDYAVAFEEAYTKLCRKKLGLIQQHSSDLKLMQTLLPILSYLSIDYTFFFRNLSNPKEVWDYYGERSELKEWFELYNARLKHESTTETQREQLIKSHNPKYILRNYIAQEIIEDVEKGSSTKLSSWLNIFYHPYDEHPEYNNFARPTPPDRKNYIVSCSS